MRSRRPPWFVLRRAVVEFVRDDGIDVSASLAFYGLLSVLPAAVALLSLVGVTGQTGALIDLVDEVGRRVLSPERAASLAEVLDEATAYDGAALTLAGGALGLLWTASIYVNGFGRAVNRIYEVDEGRPFWRLRPLQVGVTLVVLLVVALGLVAVLVTGPVARAVGGVLGLGDDFVAVYDVAKWPLLGLVLMLLLAMLFHWTPNVRFARFRVVTPGTVTALVVMAVASAVFAAYVTRRGSFDSTYGTLGGAVLLGLWLWLVNIALVFGAELDAELERGRQLREGLPAEERLVMATRTDRVAVGKQRRDERDVARMRSLRERHGPPRDDA